MQIMLIPEGALCFELRVEKGNAMRSFLLFFPPQYKFSFLIAPQCLMLEITMGVVSETFVVLILICARYPVRCSFRTGTKQVNIIPFHSTDKTVHILDGSQNGISIEVSASGQRCTCLTQCSLLTSNSVNPSYSCHIMKNPNQYYTVNFQKL